MKISYNWLKRYLQTEIPVSQIEEILTSIGLEVESVETTEQIPGGLAGVFTGEVVECAKHPGADKLSLTKVDVGSGELLSIVCGAPNVAAGQKVLVATVGTTLTFAGGEVLKIKRSKIRGEESMGMICAEDELGIGTSHEGIMVLASDTPIGISAKEFLKLESDTVFEIGLTPNRIDAASHIGVARDLNAYLKFNGIGCEFQIPGVHEFEKLQKSDSTKAATLEVTAKDGAPKYYGLTMDNVTVSPSPEWLQNALKAIGLRPINNVVDVTNFVLHETGHPLHAFDYDKIDGGKVVVRRAFEGEKFVTLDQAERVLSAEDLMICNEAKPMCIAGVFGGEESGVTAATTKVFLESAYFNPVSVRKSSKRHNLKTDASFRFERGADPDNVEFALKRAAILLSLLSGARVCGEIVRFDGDIPSKAVAELDFSRMERLIGKKIGVVNIKKLLELLDFDILSVNGEGAKVSVPRYRVDVTRECDVVEDILRIYGYNNIELPQRMSASLTPGVKPDPERIRTLAANLLVDNGFYEMMNNSLTKSDYYSKLKTYPEESLVRLLNPLSSDLNAMRQTLLLNGLEVVAYNVNRQHTELRLFEFGNVYSLEQSIGSSNEAQEPDKLKAYKESSRLSMVVTGQGSPYWRGKKAPGNYFMLKGYVEALLKRFGIDINDFEYVAAPADLFEEGLALKTKSGKELGYFGTVRKSLAKQFDIKQDVYAAELSWEMILTQVKKKRVLYSELPKYPSVTRDLALLVDEAVTYSQLRQASFSAERKLLKNVVLFDVYRGDKIPAGKKQYALSFTLQDLGNTLTDKVVEEVMSKLLDTFSKNFGASLR